MLLAEFISGKRTLLTATSSLGLGLDAPNILLVVHVGAPRTLPNYVQESGRAGRRGEVCTAVLITGDLYDARSDSSPGAITIQEYMQKSQQK